MTTRRPPKRRTGGGQWVLGLMVVGALALAGGCASIEQISAGAGEMTLRSRQREGPALAGAFARGFYRMDDTNHLTLVLVDGPEDQPTRAASIRMTWRPRAGRTPIDATATNATIHYMIFTGSDGGDVGVYSGGGFLYPHAPPGKASLKLALWDSSLRLSDRSASFDDLLGQAVLSGRMSVRRDPVATTRLLRQLDQMVSARLGYPRMVMAR